MDVIEINMKKEIDEITLRPVSRIDCKFLYQLLKERDPKVNISHKKIPLYKDHVKFVMSKPYSQWYIIKYKKNRIGSIYLTKHNEIGIFLRELSHGKGIGQKALELIMQYNPRSRFLANVSPRNTKSMKFFKRNGFHLVQYTYELIVPEQNKKQ